MRRLYLSEWGFAKLLHWLRHNPEKRSRFVTALEHCDMVTATLCGIKDPLEVPRSVCAMGHKWMWNESLGGLPGEDFLAGLDPLSCRRPRHQMGGRYASRTASPERSPAIGRSASDSAPGIPIPVGALDAHWDAIGAGIRLGDVVNVIGTSTCVMAISDALRPDPGGVRRRSRLDSSRVHGHRGGTVGGGRSLRGHRAAGGRRRRRPLDARSPTIGAGRPGCLRLTWDNGDPHRPGESATSRRDPRLEPGSHGRRRAVRRHRRRAFHTRIILERMAEHGVPVNRVINGGGHSAEESRAQPHLRQRTRYTGPRAGRRSRPASARRSSRSSRRARSARSRRRRTRYVRVMR